MAWFNHPAQTRARHPPPPGQRQVHELDLIQGQNRGKPIATIEFPWNKSRVGLGPGLVKVISRLKARSCFITSDNRSSIKSGLVLPFRWVCLGMLNPSQEQDQRQGQDQDQGQEQDQDLELELV